MYRKQLLLRLLEGDSGGNSAGGTPPANAPAANTGSTPAQAATNTSPDAPAADGQQSEPITLEEARRLRSEGKALRERLKSAETAAKELADLKKQIEDEKLSEKEKLEKRLTEAQLRESERELQTQERLIQAEIRTQLALAGITKERMTRIAKLIDYDRLEFDERSGEPTNVAALLQEIFQEIPELDPKRSAPPPAQQAQQQQQNAQQPTQQLRGLSRPQQQPPAVPAMNPGRTSIPAPGTVPPGKRPSLAEAHELMRQQQQRGS